MKRNRLILGSLLAGAVLGGLLGNGVRLALFDAHESDRKQWVQPDNALDSHPEGLTLTRNQLQNQAEREAFARSSQTQRWLWLASQAETASASEMLRLVALAGEDTELRKMLASQWGKAAPEHMLRTLVSEIKAPASALHDPGELLRWLFREWGERDAHGLADALADESMFVGYRGLRTSAVSAITNHDPGLGLRLLTDWGIQDYTPSLSKVADWGANAPEAAGTVIGRMTNPYARESAFEELAKSWVKSDPEAALQFAQTNLVGAAQRELSAAVMKRWAETNLNDALTFASSQEDRALLSALSEPLVEAWAKEDPAKALAWSEETLPAPARARAIGAIIGAIAADDLQAGIGAVGDMAPGGAKRQASEALLRTWIDESDVDVAALGAWLGNIDDAGTRTSILNNVQWDWARKHRDSAKAFLASGHGHLASSSMVRRVVQDDVRQDPHAAMEWADTLPETVGETAHYSIVRQWHRLQPAAAQEWALTKAQGEQRTRAIDGITRELAFAGEERLRTWADQLGADERRKARESLDAMRLADRYAEVVQAVFGE